MQLLLLVSSGSTSQPPAGVLSTYYANGVLSEPACSTLLPSIANLSLDATALSRVCGGKLSPVASTLWSARLYGELHLPLGHYQLRVRTNLGTRLFVHGWQLIDSWSPSDSAQQHVAKYNFSVVSNTMYPVRLDLLFASRMGNRSGSALPALFEMSYRNATPGGAASWAPLPRSALAATVSPQQAQRQALQSAMSAGWNTWHRASATAHVHLPSLFGFDVALTERNATLTGPRMDRSTGCSGCTDRCDQTAAGAVCQVRPGTHTNNGSFTHFDQHVRAGLRVAFKSAHVDATGQSSVLLLTANGTEDVAALELQLLPAFFFDCGDVSAQSASGYAGGVPCGEWSVGADGASALGRTFGLSAERGGSTALRIVGANRRAATAPEPLTVHFDIATRSACVIAQPSRLDASATAKMSSSANAGSGIGTLAECIAIVRAAERNAEAALAARYPRSLVGTNRDVVDAMRAVIGWNVMWHPTAFVVTPVSRTFGKQPFEMWLWDTYFSTLLSAESDKALAYSNLIEITRPTVAGNVPGFRTQDTSVQDRSKPYVGALVLLRLYEKFSDEWIVELLFDDLLAWANWVALRRTEGPSNLVVIGSDHVATGQSDARQCTKTAVIWESGLDNSPLYDPDEIAGLFTPNATVGAECNFHFYDAGMTGLYLSTLDSLATLATAIGRNGTAATLRARHDAMAKAMRETLWSDGLGVFVNTGSSPPHRASSRITPFSFHAMLSGAATAAQARTMAQQWLLTDAGFCLTGQNESRPGRGEACVYGMPSIAHSDPAWKDNTYWRGRTWGPMNWLVYAGLRRKEYAGVAEVRLARARLAERSRALLLKEWLSHHHVHENYNSASGDGCDVGDSDPFYHWGALLGLISLEEAGLY